MVGEERQFTLQMLMLSSAKERQGPFTIHRETDICA